MKTVNSCDRPLFFTVSFLAAFTALTSAMGQAPAPVSSAESAAAVAPPLTFPPRSTYGSQAWTKPAAMPAYEGNLFVDPYQFQEVVRPKLPLPEKDNAHGTEMFWALRQWIAQLGVEMNETNGWAMMWHDDGRLLVYAPSGDLNAIEGAIKTMSKEYSGKPHPRLEIRVMHLAPDGFEASLRKLKLLSEAADHTPDEVNAAVVRRFAQLGVNLALPKTCHYDRSRGYLAVCASRADLEIIEPEVARLDVTQAWGHP